MTQRYFIELAYKGTNFHGWQIQPNAVSVQECLEKALSVITRETIAVTGAGRTDTGVHASYFVAHFDSGKLNLDHPDFTHKLNSFLGKDIVIFQVSKVTTEAHARFDATSRTYQYHLNLRKDPFALETSWYFFSRPDVERMNEASRILFEYTDFTSFSKLHTDVKTNNCKIYCAEWTQESANIVFTVKADRFLRNMVRALVGTILEVGIGKIDLNQFRKIIEQKDRGAAGLSVPAHGLFLTDIEYPKEIFNRRFKE
ncbi:tRNA pseudouridine synthase A [Aquipluma nitroreducens]|uniref:tRNA pseudouridine synthase A n=1 Tax=Aquipluma nitroreducens TaxID=2010828 RepID=A0A5K7SDT0_9BACT|nr:tRNA pseudouridine(38-40) synthase TruA [Aquipluma nitroreducens]BBE19414.1 tRNA pseudouridine synthase A [Aquipluma nitroreducens]